MAISISFPILSAKDLKMTALNECALKEETVGLIWLEVETVEGFLCFRIHCRFEVERRQLAKGYGWKIKNWRVPWSGDD